MSQNYSYRCGVYKADENMMLHIGKRIKETIRDRGMSVVDFSRALPCSRENAYRIFKKDNIDIQQLRRIGRILKCDFFKMIGDCDE